jgi:hypothetical protein
MYQKYPSVATTPIGHTPRSLNEHMLAPRDIWHRESKDLTELPMTMKNIIALASFGIG